jgi:hypothetical protein
MVVGTGVSVGMGKGEGEGDGVVNIGEGTAVLSGRESSSCLPPLQATRLLMHRANTSISKRIDWWGIIWLPPLLAVARCPIIIQTR